MDETTRLRALLQDASFLFVDVHAAMTELRETAPEYWRVNGIGDQIATWQIHTAEVLGGAEEPDCGDCGASEVNLRHCDGCEGVE